MSALVWGLLVLVVCPLLQLPAIVYLSRRMETDEEPPPPSVYGHTYPAGSDTADSATAEHDRRAAESRSRTVEAGPAKPSDPYASAAGICPECGAKNDPAYRYCGDCAARLR